jgi:opacity protein-like surface antigen
MRTSRPGSLLLAAAIALAIAPRAHAQDATQAGAAKSAAAAEVSVGTAVADRALTGAAESFPKGTAKLVCLSKVTGAENSEIEHVWYKGDAEQARVKLKVGGSPWRTYSTKTLGPDASGDWRCDVVQNGTVLQSVKFKVE